MKNKYNLLVIVTFILMSMSFAQNWNGQYKLRGNCDSSRCCCRTGTMTISRSSSSLTISSNGAGCPTTTMSSAFSFYGGYTLEYTVAGSQIVRLTLSYAGDSVTISNSIYSYCDDVATRSNKSVIRTMPWHFSFWFVFIWIMKESFD